MNMTLPIAGGARSRTAMPQVFQLISGPIVQELLMRPCNRIDDLISTAGSDEDAVKEMFVTTLGREPESEETSHSLSLIRAAADLRSGLEDVMWALINSKEFLFRR